MKYFEIKLKGGNGYICPFYKLNLFFETMIDSDHSDEVYEIKYLKGFTTEQYNKLPEFTGF